MFSYRSYGILKPMREVEIKQLINRMLVEGLLSVTNDKYAILKITERAEETFYPQR